MGDELVQLEEGPGVEQEIQPLPGGELACLMLLGDALGPATQLGLSFQASGGRAKPGWGCVR
jgi:hypothetical protein